MTILKLYIFYFLYPLVLSGQFTEIFKWKQIEYELPSSLGNPDFTFPEPLRCQKCNHSHNDPGFDYVAYNNVPMGVTHHKGRVFVTMPRRRPGIPATLNYIDLNIGPYNPSPKLKGYPNYEINGLDANLQPNMERIVSVYRTRADVCDRLWFIDTGVLEYPNNRQQIQQPSIWIFNLSTNMVIKRFAMPENIVTDGRGLASITIDTDKHNCNRAYAYIPDLLHYELHVYSLHEDSMWTFQHNYFSFDPLWGDFNLAGQLFQWNDGIFSITLGNKDYTGYRTAYFHPMCSISEFAVSTKVLQNETNSGRSYHGSDFRHLGYRGNWRQSTMHDFDPETGVIFYAEISKYGIGCWNSNKPIIDQHVVTLHANEQEMIYPSDLTIDSDGYVWVMTNSMPLFIYASLNANEYNFRIWKQSAKTAIQHTPCE